jgi:hypothetical protein
MLHNGKKTLKEIQTPGLDRTRLLELSSRIYIPEVQASMAIE